MYLTEDNFAFPSGLYRYRPPVNPMEAGRLANGGRLQMLRVKGSPRPPRGGAGHRRQLQGGVGGHRRPEPDVPVHARPAGTHHEQRSHRLRRRAGPRAGRRPLLPPGGRDLRKGEVYFTSHAGRRAGGDRPAADPSGTGAARARCGRTTRAPTAHLPLPVAGNGNARAAGQHHGAQQPRDDRAVRGRPRRQLHPRPQPSVDLVRHRPEPADRNNAADGTFAPRFAEEFAGATFSPDGQTLFVNIQAAQALTFAIWGPWSRLGV